MPTRKALLFFVLAAGLATAVAAAANAQPLPPMGPPGPGPVMAIAGPMPMPLMMVLRQVNPTPEQEKKIHEIMDSTFKQGQPMMKQLGDIHDQIADKLMSAGPVSESDLAPLQHQEDQIRQQLDRQMLAAALQVRGVLTPDQLSKAAEIHTKLKSLRSQMDVLMGGDKAFFPGPPPGGF